MIKKNKNTLIFSSIVILLPIIFGIFLWDVLPQQISTHWGVNGKADGWGSRAFAVFVLPLILLAVQWIGVLITICDSKNREQNDKVFGVVLWIIPIVSLICNGMVYALALGENIAVDIVVRVLFGIMFIVLGNYMPKCKQNNTIGVKVKWTLRNEENWYKTHRFTGRLWVFGGLFVLATIFIPLKSFVYVLLVGLFVLAFTPMIYSYVYYRKQLKSGSLKKEDVAMTEGQKKFSAVSMVITLVILVAVGIFLCSGNIQIQYEDTSFTLKADYWEDLTVDYDRIDTIEYRKQDEPGDRIYGFGSFKLLMGNFQNDEFGSYTRYSYAACDSCIVLSADEKILVLNGKDEESTKEIYEELSKHLN